MVHYATRRRDDKVAASQNTIVMSVYKNMYWTDTYPTPIGWQDLIYPLKNSIKIDLKST